VVVSRKSAGDAALIVPVALLGEVTERGIILSVSQEDLERLSVPMQQPHAPQI